MNIQINGLLVRLKCKNCKLGYFEKKDKSKFFCSKDCLSSYNIRLKKKAIP